MIELISHSEHPMRQAREWALQCLYQIEISGFSTEADWVSVCRQFTRHATLIESQRHFIADSVMGVLKNQAVCDLAIQKASPKWRLERMGAVDRNILRLGTYELLFESERGHEIVINEAVELAKVYGSPDSARFVNGLLQEIYNSRPAPELIVHA